MSLNPKNSETKSRREITRSMTVRLNADVANLLDGVAAELQWSTSKLIGRLVELSAPELIKFRQNGDLGGLFSHLVQKADTSKT
jgi:hypothetical protein